MSFTNFPLSQNVSTGLGGLADAQLARDALRNQVQPSKDIMISRTSGGTFLSLRNPRGGGGTSLTEYIVAEDQPDWIETSDGTKILKPKYLRGASKPVLHGGLWHIRPAYEVGDKIYAFRLKEKEGFISDLLDVNVDARAWYYQLGVCIDGSMSRLWVASQGFV
jgi:hypothetical protein